MNIFYKKTLYKQFISSTSSICLVYGSVAPFVAQNHSLAVPGTREHTASLIKTGVMGDDEALKDIFPAQRRKLLNGTDRDHAHFKESDENKKNDFKRFPDKDFNIWESQPYDVLLADHDRSHVRASLNFDTYSIRCVPRAAAYRLLL